MENYTRKFELIDSCLKRLSEIKRSNPNFKKYKSSWKDKDAAERNLQKIIEAIIDIGKMLIAEKKLHEPGNNREVFFIPLMDRIIGMRNILVHSYDRIDDEIVYEVIKKHLNDIKRISSYFKRIIKN